MIKFDPKVVDFRRRVCEGARWLGSMHPASSVREHGCISAGKLVGLIQVFTPTFQALIADHCASVALHGGIVGCQEPATIMPSISSFGAIPISPAIVSRNEPFAEIDRPALKALSV